MVLCSPLCRGLEAVNLCVEGHLLLERARDKAEALEAGECQRERGWQLQVLAPSSPSASGVSLSAAVWGEFEAVRVLGSSGSGEGLQDPGEWCAWEGLPAAFILKASTGGSLGGQHLYARPLLRVY